MYTNKERSQLICERLPRLKLTLIGAGFRRTLHDIFTRPLTVEGYDDNRFDITLRNTVYGNATQTARAKKPWNIVVNKLAWQKSSPRVGDRPVDAEAMRNCEEQ